MRDEAAATFLLVISRYHDVIGDRIYHALYKSLALAIGGVSLYSILRPYYDAEVEKGTMQIVGVMHRTMKNGKMSFSLEKKVPSSSPLQVDYVLVSDHYFFNILQEIRAVMPSVPPERILDGKMFQVRGFSLTEFLRTGVVHGTLPAEREISFSDGVSLDFEKVYQGTFHTVVMGRKSYAGQLTLAGVGSLQVGKFSSIANKCEFQLGLNNYHDYHRVFTFDFWQFRWDTAVQRAPVDRLPGGRIQIGNDVWLGRGVRVKCPSWGGVLRIGDGAVVAADSVVVKDVPPYAIVGGNPAKIIKYRFSPEEIAAIERIQWWDWPDEKIHDAIDEFDHPRDFIKKYDHM